jgi:retron-type reverse transcriptase
MKRVDHLLEKAVEPENLRLAFWKAKKGKSYSKGVLAYQSNLEANLFRLREQMLTGFVELGNYHFFNIFDPKERRICAPAFAEQVLHHALMNVCHEHFERAQVFDSYASRQGKGVHAALRRAQVFTRRHEWFLKLDVCKFFERIHHDVLKEQLRRMFKDYRVLDLLEKIIDSYETQPGRGLPIGNLTSQYFANHYLAGLDHFIRRELQIGSCVRYMDDLVLWHSDKGRLKAAHVAVSDFVRENLSGELKPELLNRSTCGLPFLGYLVYPFQTRLARRSKRRFVKKMDALNHLFLSGEWSGAKCQCHALPLIAVTSHANAGGFRRRLRLEQTC